MFVKKFYLAIFPNTKKKFKNVKIIKQDWFQFLFLTKAFALETANMKILFTNSKHRRKLLHFVIGS